MSGGRRGGTRTGLAEVPDLLDGDGDEAIENDEGAKHGDDLVELAEVEGRHLDDGHASSFWELQQLEGDKEGGSGPTCPRWREEDYKDRWKSDQEVWNV